MLVDTAVPHLNWTWLKFGLYILKCCSLCVLLLRLFLVRLTAVVAYCTGCWEADWTQREQFFSVWSGDRPEIRCHHHRLQRRQEEQSDAGRLQNGSVRSCHCVTLFLLPSSPVNAFPAFFTSWYTVPLPHGLSSDHEEREQKERHFHGLY